MENTKVKVNDTINDNIMLSLKIFEYNLYK